MYGAGDYDLAGFAVGVVERTELLDGSRIRPGHRLLGMASSGPHSNGYSLIRKVLERSGASLEEVLTNPDGSTIRLGDALLAPTTLYVKPVLAMLGNRDAGKNGGIDGLAHITGGGLTENIIRVIPDDCGLLINPAAWPRPAVFSWLQQQGGISDTEMLRTFNCGIGMVMLVDADKAAALVQASNAAGIPCHDIGHVVNLNPGNRATQQRVEYLPG
jgi:phosphoribosylformylglycinamidine cyclo-ligase